MKAKDYTHELDVDVRSISGGYQLDEESVLLVDDREILFAVGNGMVDSSCCGTYGCRFAVVPGYVVKFQYRTDRNGTPVSAVEPIWDEAVKKEVVRILSKRDGVSQVRFW